MINRVKILFPAILAVGLTVQNTFASGTPVPEIDAETFEMLAGKVEIPEEATDIDIAIPSFIRKSSNRITLNGADWTGLREAFRSCAKSPVSVVHIGDSHVQADISTGTTRELLQYDFGNAGRGLVTPLKISGTNQPNDYVFQSHNSWNPVKLMSAKWNQTVGFTGASIHPMTSSSEITIGTSQRDDYNPFSSLTLFHNGSLTIRKVTTPEGKELEFRSIPSHDYTQIVLPSPQANVRIDFASSGDLTLYGALLSGDRPGLFYHAIGNNGAAYETYNRIGNVGAGIVPLSPNLIIISLGTNEAFGKLNTATFKSSIDRLVKNIQSANPNATLLLTTPMECQKSVAKTKKVRIKNKKGRYQTVNRTTRSYSVNTNISPLRNVILEYGRENGIAVYDWYEVAGGNGASTSWINNNLFAKDRVHHTAKGYTIEGRLLYDAIMDALRQN